MAFDFGIKRSTIPHVDTLSFKAEHRKNISYNMEDKFSYWIETDILPL